MVETRICNKCGVEKPIEEFPKRYYQSNQYRRRVCKACLYPRANERRRTDHGRMKGREHNAAYMRRVRAADPEKYRLLCIEGKRKLRRQAIETLGSKCVYCGCDVFEALEINHIDGSGRQEWLKIGSSPMHRMIRDGEYPFPVELTCRVCNSVHYLKTKGIEGFQVTFERTPV